MARPKPVLVAIDHADEEVARKLAARHGYVLGATGLDASSAARSIRDGQADSVLTIGDGWFRIEGTRDPQQADSAVRHLVAAVLPSLALARTGPLPSPATSAGA